MTSAVRVRGLSSVDIFGQRGWGSSEADVCTFWYKDFGILKIYGVSAQTKGLSQCEYFVERRVNFLQFCMDKIHFNSELC